MEEGELVFRKENKQQKMAKDPRDKSGPFLDNRNEDEVRWPQRAWAPLTRNGGCCHPIRCFDMGRAKRPCQLLSTSPTTASPSS